MVVYGISHRGHTGTGRRTGIAEGALSRRGACVGPSSMTGGQRDDLDDTQAELEAFIRSIDEYIAGLRNLRQQAMTEKQRIEQLRYERQRERETENEQ